MALADMFKKKYTSNVWCNNCNTHSEVSIPKGVTLLQFVEGGSCPNCGCNTLVAGYKQIEEFNEKPKPQVKLLMRKQDLQQPRRAQVPEPRPSNRPENLPPKRREAVPEPDFRPKGVYTNDMDFWMGKDERRR